MDKASLKLLLQSFRSQDADDPIFAEALREVADDPELATWFEEMQRFDRVMESKFQDVQVPVPADMKGHILLGYEAVRPVTAPNRKRGWIIAGSMAAALLLGLLFLPLIVPRPHRDSPLALQAISFTGQMPPLQFVCFNPAVVADWINEQPGTRKVGLTMPKLDQSLSMAVIGSSVVDWNGQPVVMICLQNGRQMAMLYVLKADGATAPPEGGAETIERNGWVVRTTRANGQVRLLATRGGPANLNFQMPF